ATGQISNVIRTLYTGSVNKDLYPKKPNFFKKILDLVFFFLAWLPFILSIYNIGNGISKFIRGTGSTASDGLQDEIMSYLSLFTTVVFGIQGFFKRYWNKKSKTKTIDFIFAGYIFIGIGVNMLFSFSNISAEAVQNMMDIRLFGIPIFQDIFTLYEGGKFSSPLAIPIIMMQSLITATYGTYLLLNTKSDFHADIRLSAVTKAFGIDIDQLTLGEKFQKRIKKPKYNLPVLFKSALLPPVYTGNGVDLNKPVREKASQFLFLASINNKELAKTIVDIVMKRTIEKDKKLKIEKKERQYVSKEAVDMLGYIGKRYPDLVMERFVAALVESDIQIQKFILDAMGDIGESETNLNLVLASLKPLLVASRDEVRIAAFNTVTESLIEGDYNNKEFVDKILGMIYDILENFKDNPDIIDTAIDALLKVSVKVAEHIDINKVLPFINYQQGKNERLLNFIIENAISILGYLVYYNLNRFPVGMISTYLQDERANIRYYAVDALGNYILNSIDDGEREMILSGLMEMSLNDPNPDVTEMCRESITELIILHPGFTVEGKTVLNYYMEALNSENRQVKENASEALKSIAPLYQENVYPFLIEKIKGDNIELTRDCLYTLGSLSEEMHAKINLDEIYPFTKHPDASTRSEAVRALGGISGSRSDVDAQVLYDCLDDKDQNVRLEAIFALGKLGLQKPKSVSQVLIERLYDIDRESSSRVSEVELYAESLGIIGEAHPSNEIIISLQQALMGDTNVFAKDVIAKALGRIGSGLIRSGKATRTIENEAFYNAISWLQVSDKLEYTIGNLIIIFIEALQQKGIPASVMDIISDSIQDILPVFVFSKDDKQRKKGDVMVAIKDLLAQAYYSNFNQEILETIDRCDSLINFKRIFENDDPALQEQLEFFAKQYTPDGKQFNDQGEIFLLLGDEFLDKALKSFEIATELGPNEYYTPRCYLNRGIIFMKMGDYTKAKEEIEEAMEAFTALDDVESMKFCEEKIIEVKIQLTMNL
ncbi:MAG: HEAT repeat domain-containing protein, partial [Candidatus Hodarchaeota archaeon]